MTYGDLQFFDIIIFAAIAIFLVFRLRKVLGRKTGYEKKQENNFNQTQNYTEESNKNPIPELEDNIIELKKAYEILTDFDHNNFLEGAKAAFETIINSFNKGDKKNLKGLLTKEVFNIFEKEIDNNKNDPESQIFSLNIKRVDSVSTNLNKIFITVRFISEQFRNNDESTILKKEDSWSFEKIIKSKDPSWLLCST